MVITVRRSGGFAGRRERVGPVDTTRRADGPQIEAHVAAIGFFDIPEQLEPSPDAPRIFDAYFHEIEVVDGERTHAVGFPAGADSERFGLGTLIGLVMAGGLIWQADRSVRCRGWTATRAAGALEVRGDCEPPLGWHLVLEPAGAAEPGEPTAVVEPREAAPAAELGETMEPAEAPQAPEPAEPATADVVLALKARLEQGFAETGPVRWAGAAAANVTKVQVSGSVNALVAVTEQAETQSGEA